MLRPVIDFLYPRLCAACGTRLQEVELLLCVRCLANAPGLDVPGSGLARSCSDLHSWLGVETFTALWRFEGPVRDLVHSFKYGGLWSAAEEAGRWLGVRLEQLHSSWLPDLIVPVPLHPARLRERGYNQAACIARGTSRILGIPLGEDIADRKRQTGTQTSLDRDRRRKNVAGAFRVRRPDRVRDAHVLIVDDVVTTGATVGSLAAVLRDAGAESCGVAAIAVAPGDTV